MIFSFETAGNYLRVCLALVSYHVNIGKTSSTCLGTEDSASVKRVSLLVAITHTACTSSNK
jgi:hypothetical protein